MDLYEFQELNRIKEGRIALIKALQEDGRIVYNRGNHVFDIYKDKETALSKENLRATEERAEHNLNMYREVRENLQKELSDLRRSNDNLSFNWDSMTKTIFRKNLVIFALAGSLIVSLIYNLV